MKTREREKESRDSILVMLLILLFGFICIILASGWAIRFVPSWRLPANMGSSLNPNSDFMTDQPLGLLQPLDPAILTNPVWYDVFLTPGSTFSTRTPRPTNTNTPVITIPPSQTPQPAPTSTVTPTVFFPPLPVNTSTSTRVPATPVSPSAPPPTLTASNTPSPTFTPSITPSPTLTPSNTPSGPAVDLLIDKTDNVTHYSAGMAVRYIITVSNPVGPDTVAATVTDTFPSNLTNITWVCAGVPSSSASCTSSGTGNISDPAVVLPAGGLVIYTVDATVIASPVGDLINTANVSSSSNPDPDLTNNSSTDTDILVATNPLPPGAIAPNDGIVDDLAPGTWTFYLPTVADGDANPDLIFYEFLNAGNVYMDWMEIQVGNGTSWYTVFYWGDEVADANTNMDYNLLPCPPMTAPFPPGCPPGGPLYEPDEREIPAGYFSYPPSGITIDLAGVPPGTYPWVRIISPPGGADNKMEIDGLVTCPSASCP